MEGTKRLPLLECSQEGWHARWRPCGKCVVIVDRGLARPAAGGQCDDTVIVGYRDFAVDNDLAVEWQ